MASESGVATAPEAQTIDLKVLSPSTEISGDLHFPSLPSKTTVGELKLKIRDAVATHPAVERQRLIYRGRVMADETATMVAVFGAEAIQQATTHTLHLVLRELHGRGPGDGTANPTTRPSGVPPSWYRPGPPPAPGTPPPRNPFIAQPAPEAARPASQPQVPQTHMPQNHQHHHHHPHIHPHMPPMPGQVHIHPPIPGFPLPNEMLQNINQMMNQQLAGGQTQPSPFMPQFIPRGDQMAGLRPEAAPGQADIAPSPTHDGQQGTNGQATPQPPNAHSIFQQQVNQQQRQRAAAGVQGVTANRANNQNSDGQDPASDSRQPDRQSAASPATQPNPPVGQPTQLPNGTNTFTTEGVTPNGHRWTMTMNTNAVTLPYPGPGAQQHPMFLMPPLAPHFARTGTPPVGLPVPPGTRRTPSPSAMANRQDLQSLMSRLEQAQREVAQLQQSLRELQVPGTDAGSLPQSRHAQLLGHAESLGRIFDQVQTGLNNMAANPDYAANRDMVSLQMMNNNLRAQAGGLVQNINRMQPANLTLGFSQPPNAQTMEALRLLQQPPPTTAHQPANTSLPTSIAPTTSPELYLLSSPTGPQGLLVGPTGNYITPPLGPGVANALLNSRQLQDRLFDDMDRTIMTNLFPMANFTLNPNLAQPQNTNQTTAPTTTQPQQHQQQPGQAPHANQPDPQAPAQPQAQNPNNELRDLLRDLRAAGPAADHFWTLFRICMFIYFFSGPTGLRRPLVLCAVGALFFLVRLGLFGNRLQGVRRHFEGLLPPGARGDAQRGQGPGQDHGQPQQGQDGQRGQDQAGPAAGARAEAAQPGGAQQPTAARLGQPQQLPPPTPERTAQRLLWQQEQRNRGWLRERVHTVERAVALFIASLWPGFGERVVAVQNELQALLEARAGGGDGGGGGGGERGADGGVEGAEAGAGAGAGAEAGAGEGAAPSALGAGRGSGESLFVADEVTRGTDGRSGNEEGETREQRRQGVDVKGKGRATEEEVVPRGDESAPYQGDLHAGDGADDASSSRVGAGDAGHLVELD